VSARAHSFPTLRSSDLRRAFPVYLRAVVGTNNTGPFVIEPVSAHFTERNDDEKICRNPDPYPFICRGCVLHRLPRRKEHPPADCCRSATSRSPGTQAGAQSL